MLLRVLVLVICLAGCKKKEREMATELPPTPSSGHSVTHFKDASDVAEIGSAEPGSGSAGSAVAATIDAGPKLGGNGAAAYRDPDGRVHGPGGPVYTGEGAPCDAAHDHCMRDGVWFLASNYTAGSLYRATPCFELEGKWYSWRGEELHGGGKLFKTRLAKPEDVAEGKPIVFFTPEDDPRDKWVSSEYEALTSSRWDVGVPDSVNAAAKTFKTRAWPDPIDIETARAIIEEKSR